MTMLTTRQKQLLMFSPLAILFIGFGMFVWDIKHPNIEETPCKVLAAGLSASRYRTPHNVLYTSSGQKIHDVGFQCPKLGTVIINDFDMFVAVLEPGDPAKLSHKTYRFLPERWAATIYHNQ